MATPKLRFKEFDEKYKSILFKDIEGFSIKSGKSNGRKETGKYSFYGSTGLIGYKDDYDYTGEAILIARVGVNAGSLYKVEGKYSVSDNTLMLSASANISLNYIRELLIKFNLNKLVFGTGQPLVTGGLIKKISVSVPKPEEQTKIATFLTAVDTKIDELIQKHELLSEYKKGMMQQLFSQKLRFKADDGSDFEDWEESLIGNVFTNKSESFNPKVENNLPCIELEHLSQGTGTILGTTDSKNQKSTKNVFERSNVLYGKLRPYLNKFAQPDFKGVCSTEIWVLTGIEISNNYLYQYIQSEGFSELTSIQSGSKMPRADWKTVASAVMSYPCCEEQTKIANFLTAIDQKIDNVAEQIDHAKTWKKGLLQQMFV